MPHGWRVQTHEAPTCLALISVCAIGWKLPECSWWKLHAFGPALLSFSRTQEPGYTPENLSPLSLALWQGHCSTAVTGCCCSGCFSVQKSLLQHRQDEARSPPHLASLTPPARAAAQPVGIPFGMAHKALHGHSPVFPFPSSLLAPFPTPSEVSVLSHKWRWWRTGTSTPSSTTQENHGHSAKVHGCSSSL